MKGLGSAVTDALDAYFNNEWSSHAGKSEILGLGQGDYLGLPTDDASWGFKTFTDVYKRQRLLVFVERSRPWNI